MIRWLQTGSWTHCKPLQVCVTGRKLKSASEVTELFRIDTGDYHCYQWWVNSPSHPAERPGRRLRWGWCCSVWSIAHTWRSRWAAAWGARGLLGVLPAGSPSLQRRSSDLPLDHLGSGPCRSGARCGFLLRGGGREAWMSRRSWTDTLPQFEEVQREAGGNMITDGGRSEDRGHVVQRGLYKTFTQAHLFNNFCCLLHQSHHGYRSPV